ncbi:hypothetical protein KUL17_41240 [Alteromonas sp. KUL17]|uniref:hypothetical protein n=1 Tax=Alteromonas sp. KUL17 TaxID=2480796 RepID=UPI0010372924|nr:hypothetical protein [Alteromonas sp. KUL17]TAP16784.1 hypothetical protein KUL49_20630 [Alteromonas sp. KUL17]GEA05227.1 hypothetical protein KUL17_41240 [Alteromonas sp. KUL17]
MDALSVISLLVGIIGTAIAIYQTAVLNESKKRNGELQFLLAGINSSAAQKMQSWQNQISIASDSLTPDKMDEFKLLIRARDDFTDLSNLTVSLEGAIDPDSSAISKMMDKYLDTVQKSNEIQKCNMQNPAREDVHK